MLTTADLTVEEWTKISPDLRWSLEQAGKFSTTNIHTLEKSNLIVPWLPDVIGSGMIRADILIRHSDGAQYCITDTELPAGWTGAAWVDFVVRLIKSPYVSEVDVLREWPITRAALIPEGAVRVWSPQDMLMVATRAPGTTVTLQNPTILPPPSQITLQPNVPTTQTTTTTTAGTGGVFQRIASTLGVSPTVVKVGAASIVGLFVVAIVVSAKKPKKGKKR